MAKTFKRRYVVEFDHGNGPVSVRQLGMLDAEQTYAIMDMMSARNLSHVGVSLYVVQNGQRELVWNFGHNREQ